MDDHKTLADRTPENGRPDPQPSAGDPAGKPIALGFFSGALGLDLGLEAAGFSVRLACEIDDDAIATIRRNRPDIPVLGDIHALTAAQVRAAAGIGGADIDLAAGSPPCQTFSTAGKRQAVNDVRGVAIWKFSTLALELNPRYIAIENVRGLLSAEGGKVLAQILSMLASGGYAISFNCYDTACFGVPQHRDRVIIIASRNGRVPHLRPTHSNRPEDGLPPWKTFGDAIGDMSATEHHYVQFPDKRLKFFETLKAGQNWRSLCEADQQAALSEAVLEADGGKVGFYRRLAWDEPCPTLVTRPDMPATALCHPAELRPLSIEEYRCIQGFPNNWGLCGDLLSQYRQLGNAVPVQFGKVVGLAILEHMRTGNTNDPVPGFRYSRYTGTSDRDWCGSPDAARARLASLAPEIRRASEETKGSLLVAVRDVLPKVKETGCLLMQAKRLCRKAGILWEPWVRENCGLSERSAQAYMRIATHWEGLSKAQTSALLTSIDGALKWLAQPRPKPETADDHGDCRSGDEGGHATAASSAASVERRGEDAGPTPPARTAASEEPGSRQDVTPEVRRELEDTVQDLVRKRDRLTREVVLLVAELVSRLVADVEGGQWDRRDRRDLSGAVNRMAASLAGIRSALASPQPSPRPGRERGGRATVLSGERVRGPESDLTTMPQGERKGAVREERDVRALLAIGRRLASGQGRLRRRVVGGSIAPPRH